MNNLRFAGNTFDSVAMIGSEFCTGYTDILGIWNNGFFCPSHSGSNENVYCCGTSYHKYCCTKSDQVMESEHLSPGGSSVTIIIALMVAVSSLILLATIISCICCPQCPNYDKSSTFYKQHKAAAYRLSSSTGDMSGSGLTKTMSVGNGNSNTTGHHHHHQPAGPVLTELTQSDQQLFQGAGQDSQWHRSIGEDQVYRQSHDQMYRQSHDQMYRQSHAYNMDLMGGGMSHSFTLPHSLSHHSSFRIKDDMTNMNDNMKYGTVGRKPREQPPAYHILPRSSYLVLPQEPNTTTPDLLQDHVGPSVDGAASVDVLMGQQVDTEPEEDIYISTKF